MYGPNDNFNLENSHLIPGMIHRAYLSKLKNENFTIWGDGTPLRQFIYSEDLAKLIIWSLENWKSDDYCMMVNPQEVSVMEIAKIITNKFGIEENKILFDKTKPSGQFRKPAISDVDWYEFSDLNLGIEKTIDWFIKNYDNARK